MAAHIVLLSDHLIGSKTLEAEHVLKSSFFIKVIELENDQLTKVEITDSLFSSLINSKFFLLLQMRKLSEHSQIR